VSFWKRVLLRVHQPGHRHMTQACHACWLGFGALLFLSTSCSCLNKN
jgi:hypothetical protein